MLAEIDDAHNGSMESVRHYYDQGGHPMRFVDTTKLSK